MEDELVSSDTVTGTATPTLENIQDDRGSENPEEADDERRPPLPPRLATLQASSPPDTAHLQPASTTNPRLLSKPTTAISSVDIQTLSFPDGTRGTFSTSDTLPNTSPLSPPATLRQQNRISSRNGSEGGDSASIMSYAPTLRANGDLESLLAEGLNAQSPAWKLLNSQAAVGNPFESIHFAQNDRLEAFDREFDEIPEVDIKTGNEGLCMNYRIGQFS